MNLCNIREHVQPIMHLRTYKTQPSLDIKSISVHIATRSLENEKYYLKLCGYNEMLHPTKKDIITMYFIGEYNDRCSIEYHILPLSLAKAKCYSIRVFDKTILPLHFDSKFPVSNAVIYKPIQIYKMNERSIY